MMFKYFLRAACCLIATLSGSALAFPINPQPPVASPVVEYYNTGIDHYFYTLDQAEMSAIDAGAAGPNWVRTGLVWYAWSSVAASGNAYFATCDRGSNPCVPVHRFYGPGPNSHFFTASPAEAAGINAAGSGWIAEGTAFFLSPPDSSGSCGSGTPVQRFHNGRGNHRYVANLDTRARMRSEQGWQEEGIAFCARSKGTVPVQRHAVQVLEPDGIIDAAACDAPTASPRSCLATRNLPVPRAVYSPPAQGDSSDPFSVKTQMWRMGNANVAQNVGLPAATRSMAAQDLFVQLSSWGDVFGLNLSTRSKLGGAHSSIAPTVRFPDGAVALRSLYRTSYELRLSFFVSVAGLRPEAGSAAYGATVIEFQDARSGHRFRATALAFGSLQGGNFVARDEKDGVVLVGSYFGPASPYGRAIAGRVMATAWGDYQWWMNRQELAAAIQSARSVEPALSPDPDDYFVRSFSLHNEIFGDGEMSMYMMGPRLEIAPVHDF